MAPGVPGAAPSAHLPDRATLVRILFGRRTKLMQAVKAAVAAMSTPPPRRTTTVAIPVSRREPAR